MNNNNNLRARPKRFEPNKIANLKPQPSQTLQSYPRPCLYLHMPRYTTLLDRTLNKFHRENPQPLKINDYANLSGQLASNNKNLIATEDSSSESDQSDYEDFDDLETLDSNDEETGDSDQMEIQASNIGEARCIKSDNNQILDFLQNHPYPLVRKNLLHLNFFTIDPKETKIREDAIYLEKHENRWKLWVAISDKFTEKDRTKSSLNKNCIKPALICKIQVNKNRKVEKYSFKLASIQVKYNFTCPQAAEIIAELKPKEQSYYTLRYKLLSLLVDFTQLSGTEPMAMIKKIMCLTNECTGEYLEHSRSKIKKRHTQKKIYEKLKSNSSMTAVSDNKIYDNSNAFFTKQDHNSPIQPEIESLNNAHSISPS